ADLDGLHALPLLTNEDVRRKVADEFRFSEGMEQGEVIARVAGLLRSGAVHTPHPRYLGLFNPDIHPICVAADALVAAFNPQLAAFSHNPAANTMEAHALNV